MSKSRIDILSTLLLLLNWNSLATETDYVRGCLAEYADDLLSLGVDGFRLDAAKRRLDSSDHGAVC